MRLTLSLLIVLVSGCSTVGHPTDDLSVRARLIEVQKPNIFCGGIWIGATAVYEVESGQNELSGKTIRVLIPCVEMPQLVFSSKSKTEQHQLGHLYDLSLTKRNVHYIEAPDALPTDGIWFYLRTVSNVR